MVYLCTTQNGTILEKYFSNVKVPVLQRQIERCSLQFFTNLKQERGTNVIQWWLVECEYVSNYITKSMNSTQKYVFWDMIWCYLDLWYSGMCLKPLFCRGGSDTLQGLCFLQNNISKISGHGCFSCLCCFFPKYKFPSNTWFPGHWFWKISHKIGSYGPYGPF